MIIVCEVNRRIIVVYAAVVIIIVACDVHRCRIRVVIIVTVDTVVIGVDKSRFRLYVMSYVLSILIDDVVGMLKVWRLTYWLTLHLTIIELLLLEMKGLLLLLLTVLCSIVAFFTFSFTLSFLVVICRALEIGRSIVSEWMDRWKKMTREIFIRISLKNVNFGYAKTHNF
jgi:hypothetical protein